MKRYQEQAQRMNQTAMEYLVVQAAVIITIAIHWIQSLG